MLLSVIVPVFNGEQYLECLIDSLESMNKDIADEMEILLINDGSQDCSLPLCYELSKRFTNIKVFDKSRGGVSEARNLGLSNASAKYITFCDQDDRVIKGYSSFIERIVSTHADLLMSNYAVLKSGNVIFTDRIKADSVAEGQTVKEWAKDCFRPNTQRLYPSIWNCIFDSDVIRKNDIKLSRFVSYEDDWKLIVDMLLVSNIVYLCKDAYYQWIFHPDSQSNITKFIPDFYQRRAQLREYVISCLNSLELRKSEMCERLISYDKDTILISISNNGRLSYREFCAAYKSASTKKSLRDFVRMFKTTGSIKERLYLALYYLHLWPIIWLIQNR